MSDKNYAWEKLWLTINILATQDGNIQSRLRDAYTSQLMRLRPDDLDAALQDDLQEILDALSECKDLDATTATRLARQILDLYGAAFPPSL